MRIITEKTVRTWAAQYPPAARWLTCWLEAASRADWSTLPRVRVAYPHADGVRVASGRTVTVFNVMGNKYRMITSIHFNRKIIFMLAFLTHAEYSKNLWKDRL